MSENRENKLIGFEVLRFITAMAVIAWHYQHFFYIAGSLENFDRAKQPFYSVFGIFYEFGLYGVQVFWCISGFIFFLKYSNVVAIGGITPKNFFYLRLSRLYPLHFFTLLIVILFQTIYYSAYGYYFVYSDNDLYHFALQIFMASNWGLERGFSFNGPIWSVSTEVLVYLFFFIIARIYGPKAWVCWVILLFCVILKVLKISLPFIDCLAFFYIGGLSFLLSKYINFSRSKSEIIMIFCVYLVILPLGVFKYGLYVYRNVPIVFLILYMPVLLAVISRDIKFGGGIERVLVNLGNLTYSSYLLHFPVQLIISLYFPRDGYESTLLGGNLFVWFFGIVISLSYLSYKYFELPFQRYIRRKMGV